MCVLIFCAKFVSIAVVFQTKHAKNYTRSLKSDYTYTINIFDANDQKLYLSHIHPVKVSQLKIEFKTSLMHGGKLLALICRPKSTLSTFSSSRLHR